MKTIEQKAKAYDRALEKSKEFYILCKKCGAKDTVEFLEDSFPELKEGEDEKVRKELIKVFSNREKYLIDQSFGGITVSEILAWLEKQGTSYTKRDIDDAYIKGMSDAKRELEKQGEKKCIDDLTQQEAMDAAVAKCFEQGGQKSAWSEEDEPQKELAETYLAVFDEKFPILPTLNGKQLADYKNFLNKCQQILGLKYWSLRPLQAKLFEKLSLLWAAWGAEHLKGLGQTNGNTDNEKQEWSEEDEKMIRGLIVICDEWTTRHSFYPIENCEIEKLKNWLESLKEKCTWKPSEEQMEALKTSFLYWNGTTKEVPCTESLESLYEQLKQF